VRNGNYPVDPLEDWYRFTGQAGVGVEVSVTAHLSSGGLRVDLYSANGTGLGAYANIYDGNTGTVTKTLTTTDVYYIKVSGTAVGNYDLRVTGGDGIISDYVLKAYLGGMGSGSIIASGLTCSGNLCAGNYNANASVTLTPVPDATSFFAGWSGGPCSGTNPCTILMDGPKTVLGSFSKPNNILNQYTLSIHLGGSGSGTVQASGLACSGNLCTGNYAADTSVTLTPISDAGSYFAGWSGSCSGTGACTILMDGPKKATANYNRPTYVLTVASSNPASGALITVRPNDTNGQGNGTTQFTRTYNSNEVVTLISPFMAGGNNFQKWQRNGADYSTNQTINVPMDGNHTLTAVYVTPSLVTRTLTVNSSNPNSGVSIAISPADNNGQSAGTTQFVRTYNDNVSVILTAPATAGANNFQKWQRNGVDYSTTGTTSVGLNANTTMTAIYSSPQPLTHILNVGLSNAGNGVSITVSPDGVGGDLDSSPPFTRLYSDGTSVTLTAPSNANGIKFINWSGCDTIVGTSCNLNMHDQRTVIAHFSGKISGAFHTFTLKREGILWGWGENYYGKLGDGTTIDSHYPIQIGNRRDWGSIVAGVDHTLGVKADGTLWAWGDNYYGQIGDGSTINRGTPVPIGSGYDWVMISAGGGHSLALKADGSIWSWGENYSGQLGDGTTVDGYIPAQVGSDSDWVMISAGYNYSMALKADGTIWGWGDNYHGQLGDGTTINKNFPTQVGTEKNWIAIAAGRGAHTLALKSNGTLWAWGDNYYGQVGDTTTANKNYPVQVGTDFDWVSISSGATHSLAIKASGTIWAWGDNRYGQLGDQTNVAKNYPVPMDAATDWALVQAGGYHNVALKLNGSVWTWGWNAYGQLGDGTTIDKNAPVLVAVPEFPGDFDADGDVDGSDLANLILGNKVMNIADFALDFGRTN
jgi:alpha-tubulin suppressor-like RCC1 family protein